MLSRILDSIAKDLNLVAFERDDYEIRSTNKSQLTLKRSS
jgi:hypothetical protein